MPNLILKINTVSDKIYQADNISCYLAEASLPDDFLRTLAESGKMLLLCGEGAADKAMALGAAGVLVSVDPKQPVKIQLRPIRETIGSKAVLGALINPSRHEAMLAAETEPEFVAFRCNPENMDTLAELLRWYNELFLIQSALDLSGGLEDISSLEADFVIINSSDYNDFSC